MLEDKVMRMKIVERSRMQKNNSESLKWGYVYTWRSHADQIKREEKGGIKVWAPAPAERGSQKVNEPAAVARFQREEAGTQEMAIAEFLDEHFMRLEGDESQMVRLQDWV